MNETTEFAQTFNGSFDCASKFIKSFDNPKEALEHFKKTQECNKRMDNFCGNNCKWIFDEKTKTLFIRGNEKMNDYKINWDYRVSTAPWAVRKQIENVVMSKGITIENCAFYNCSSLTSIIIPNSVITIGDFAFSSCPSLKPAIVPKRFKSKKDDILYCYEQIELSFG